MKIEGMRMQKNVFAKNIIEMLPAFVIGFIVGAIVGFIVCKKVDRKKKILPDLEKCILFASFCVAFVCVVFSIYGKESVSIQVLNFYTSFVFAWLLTKESSRNEFIKTQHKVVKNTYRHIEDVETTVIITKKRVAELCIKGKAEKGELLGISDELDSILAGIRSNKDDWKDMLKKGYRKKIDSQNDPEGSSEKSSRVLSPDHIDFENILGDEVEGREESSEKNKEQNR